MQKTYQINLLEKEEVIIREALANEYIMMIYSLQNKIYPYRIACASQSHFLGLHWKIMPIQHL